VLVKPYFVLPDEFFVIRSFYQPIFRRTVVKIKISIKSLSKCGNINLTLKIFVMDDFALKILISTRTSKPLGL
jgi:hypothetical protein